MSVRLRVLMAAVSLSIPLAVTSTVGVQPSWGAQNSAAAGTLKCSKSNGSITFTPALTTSGNANSEVTAIKLTLTGCVASNGHNPTKGVLTSTITTTTTDNSANSCTQLAVSKASTSKIKWTITPVIANTTLMFSGFTSANNAAGDAGYTEPNVGGTASVTGSYPGTNGGATSTGSLYTNQTSAQILTTCGSTGGVASLAVTTGKLNLK